MLSIMAFSGSFNSPIDRLHCRININMNPTINPIQAIGQASDLSFLGDDSEILVDRGLIVVNEDTIGFSFLILPQKSTQKNRLSLPRGEHPTEQAKDTKSRIDTL